MSSTVAAVSDGRPAPPPPAPLRAARRRAVAAALALCCVAGPAAAGAAPGRPNLLLVTVDTLRPDRLSGWGYDRPTSPRIDALAASGARFLEARTTVPLTCPGLASMLTALPPHGHGASRNGLPVRPGLDALPAVLGRHGWTTAAVVSNWTLRDELCGLAGWFDHWEEVLRRKRWLFGRREADADDVNAAALAWLEGHAAAGGGPFFLWVHYVEPHSPYVLHREHLDRLGHGPLAATFSMSRRYDSEVAFVDVRVGELLDAAAALADPADTLVVFTSDHGESLGHHGYWGHGRHVYEAGLRIPWAIAWPGQIEPGGEVPGPALNSDLPATVLGLLDLPVPEQLTGFDWAPVIRGAAPPPAGRVTWHQGHRGAVEPGADRGGARSAGLLEVARVERGRKEVLVVGEGEVRRFDTVADREELDDLAPPGAGPSAELAAWLEEVRAGLAEADGLPVPELDEETVERLRALGYLE